MVRAPVPDIPIERKEWLSANEVCAYLHVSMSTVMRLAKKGALTRYRIPGMHKAVRYRRDEVDGLVYVGKENRP